MAKRLQPGSTEYTALFDGFEHTAYRLETLQRYQQDDETEPLQRFLADEDQPHDPAKDRWVARIAAATAAGKTMQRVHIVVEPPSDYLRYELKWSYGPNVTAGEDIRIIPVRTGGWPAGLPRHDYWLFDSRLLCRMHYDEEMRFALAELIEDPAEIVKANHWRDAALHTAIPYHEYLASRADMLRRAS